MNRTAKSWLCAFIATGLMGACTSAPESTSSAADMDERPSILVFSKVAAFNHEDAIPAAITLFENMAAENGWDVILTEDSANFTDDTLSQFDALVFNNVTGDVFTEDQKKALKSYIEGGGGYVGFHGSGDSSQEWNWYIDELIGARFIGHPMNPQFQFADVTVEDQAHPATAHLPAEFSFSDEWYSFDASPRSDKYNILMTIDEDSYSPEGWRDRSLYMGEDHPVTWWHCQGDGRVFYTALGHRAETYEDPRFQTQLLEATKWAFNSNQDACDAKP